MKQTKSETISTQELKANGAIVTLTYQKPLINPELIQNQLIKPFFEIKDINNFYEYVKSLMGVKVDPTMDEQNDALEKGYVIVSFDHHMILIPLRKSRVDMVNETSVETTIQGPRFSFTEELIVNLNIVQSRYRNSNLTIDLQVIGEQSHMEAAILYDKTVVNQAVLDIINKKLSTLKEPIVETTEKLQNLLTDRKFKLFPVAIITERPDRVVYNIAQGKVVIFIDGSPFALIAPAAFWDFMTSMDDLYQPFFISQFIRTLRFIGLFIGLLLPALYVGILSYNPELLRTQLAISIYASRQGVPYPSYFEVLFMLFMMELLVEASIRLPKAISSTATTVGGLILGQAATEASLVSTIMIIIVSAVAISNFAIPLNHMSFAIRVMKYVLLLFGVFYGLIGIAIGLLLLIFYLCHMSSFGEPYLKMYLQKKPNELKEV